MDAQQLLSTFRRRWRFVVATLILGVGVAVALTSVITPMYVSTTRVYIASANADTQNEPWNAAIYASQRVASFAALVKDPGMLERVADRAGVALSTDELASSITVAPIPDSVIITIAVESRSPAVAQSIAAATADVLSELVEEFETPERTKDNPRPVAPIAARVTGAPSYNGNPVSPSYPLNITVGALLGLLGGVAGSLLREALDRTVRDADQLADITGASVLTVVPFDSNARKHPLITDPQASSSSGEPYRVLRTNLQFVDVDSQQRMFVMTSPVPDEGKTVTAVNLAVAMAEAGRKVLLIDGDLRKSAVASLLGLDRSIGLMTAATGRADLDSVIQLHDSGVNVLATGPLPPNPAEVLDTDTVRSLLEQARRRFEVVIIDAPPILPVADAAILAGAVGGVLLVVRLGSTNAEHVRQAVDRLRAVDAKICGVIASMAPSRAMGTPGAGYGLRFAPREITQRARREGKRAQARAQT